MSIEIEARSYGPESSEEERKAIKNRVSLYSDRIIMFKEVPVPSIFQENLTWEKISEITQELESFYMIIDLTEAKPPNAQIRDHLTKLFSSLDRLIHVAVFTERNFMLNIAAKFVLSGVGLKSFSVHKTLQEALENIHAKAEG